MRKLALLLTLLLFPAHAWALSTDELLSTIAMPLAVAAVSNIAGVSQPQLATLVTTLNQANVPATQFVEVIRYVPVALVDQNGQPFIAYVQQQTVQGVTGDALVNAIVNQLQSNYNVAPTLALNGEPTTVVLSDNYIPAAVTTQFSSNPLSLVALPLAVAAVSDITGVSQDQLANLVISLNNANVPIVQEVQIIRYAPVALVVDNGQPFVQFVQQQTSQGITGVALVPVVVQQLQTYYPPQTQIAVNAPVLSLAPQPVTVEQNFIPQVVQSRVAEMRANPHGGPPGLIKKQLGLQTGAEVVHGQKPGRQFTPAPVAAVPPMPMQPGRGHGRGRGVAPAPMMSSNPPPVAVPQAQPRGRGHAKGHGGGNARQVATPATPPMISSAPPAAVPVPAAARPAGMPPGQAKAHGGPPAGGPPGHAQGKGNGKGHGKGLMR